MRESEKVLRAPRGLPPESAFYEVILSLSFNSPRRISTNQCRRAIGGSGSDHSTAHGYARRGKYVETVSNTSDAGTGSFE